MNIVISSKHPTRERRAELWRLTYLFGVWVTTSFGQDHDVSFLWLPIDVVKSRRFPGENSDDLSTRERVLATGFDHSRHVSMGGCSYLCVDPELNCCSVVDVFPDSPA